MLPVDSFVFVNTLLLHYIFKLSTAFT